MTEPAKNPGARSLPVPRASTQFVDLGAELANVGTARRWFARGAIEGNPIVVWIGPEKSGKSWILADLVVATIAGQPWLGRFDIERPGEVLVLDAEYGSHEYTRRLARIARGRALDPAQILPRVRYLYSSSMQLTATDRDLQDLGADLSRGAVTPALVVIDPFRNHLPGDENSTKDVLAALGVINKIRNYAGCPVVIAHHLNKAGGASGARALLGRVDLIVEGSDEDCPWYGTKGRTVRVSDDIAKRFAVAIRHEHDDDDAKARTIVGLKFDGEAGRPSLSTVPALVHDILAKSEALSATAIADRLGRSNGAVKKALETLTAAGMVKAKGKKWELSLESFSASLRDEKAAK